MTSSEIVTEIEGLVDAYWALAYDEGYFRRTTDTPEGAAQETRAAISRRLSELSRRAQPVQEMHELEAKGSDIESWEKFVGRLLSDSGEMYQGWLRANCPTLADPKGTWSDGGKEWTPDGASFKAGWDKAKQLLKPEDLEVVSTTQAIDHIETLSELLKVIKEHWIDYDHIYSIAVYEADSYVQDLKGDQDGE